MYKFLPLVFLASVASLFGLAWIVFEIDPETAPWSIFGVFVILILVAVWGILGLLLYFVRTKFYKRYSADWYFKTSFKMAFFVAIFVAITVILTLLDLITTFNLVLAIVALALFATWSYLGRKQNE